MKKIKKSMSKFFISVEKIITSVVLGVLISLIFLLISNNEIMSLNSLLLMVMISGAFYGFRFIIGVKQIRSIRDMEHQLNEILEDPNTAPTNFQNLAYLMKDVVDANNSRIEELEEKEARLITLFNKIESKLVNQEEQYNEFNSILFELSGGLDTQVKSARDTSLAMEEIATGVNQIAETSGIANSSSIVASQTAQDGKRQVTSVINQMNKIDSSFSTLADTVKEFEVSTKEIGAIIEEISNIANQTNLLSLNASIEAARAGNEGKGFAVVANEVGKLSKQSNQFAERISELIKSIQVQADRASEAMDISKGDVVSGLHIVENLSSSFESINKATETINEQIHEISAISQQMAAGTEEVAASSEEITKISRKSSENFNVIIPIFIEQFDVTNTISDIITQTNNK
ncbi:hypothetical protein BKP45_11525 [Anaerobacillus alkalidiazotrophicus]|uniref:Methyl-accepting transducer domain-containing protein n=1 Tax=Anaerobacillus alkalidiazotrophicus TaxID=472963 RepID=A0A1S2M7A3_9BACI|nr:methyl-accepting chemotaxis protein [Anaerobacillus alkalidiazotrophicus]OIJ18208.1 hypothetical protein BKP45_17240 [Anaerobacillus alkalidiazotrophicus]OIJ19687.1 hypothetical protein BKP45_11525 [Anaerobacillus alkalidiazotrophicus]